MLDPNQKNYKYIIETKSLNVTYDKSQALIDVNFQVRENMVTALIGPSGCGKSTLIRCFNRMNDTIDSCKIEGEVLYRGVNIYRHGTDVVNIRTCIGMIFQKPNPFPMSIHDNVAYGPRAHGIEDETQLDELVERSLRRAVLWDEVHDRLTQNALGLSGGQQQRLCIARALAVDPEVLLMDEPTASLDPIAIAKIEDLILQLKKEITVVIVTHNMQQAARISDHTGFMYIGELIEFAPTKRLFESPKEELTEKYITGRFG
ncbi:MAG: phosphate ABC transporter ATP-binding protein [Promethearchaeota archaeon]|nr:MAG: phosphate ABC transporter ATP-binding protein [Candidatus Lokiarchaeota archaeon]